MNMPARLPISDPVAFLPGVHGEDSLAQYWLRQVTLRMRREVCWLWRERALQSGGAERACPLPPFADLGLAALDLARYDDDKQEFFANDVTAAYLSEKISTSPPHPAVTRGSFGWVVQELALAPVECFVLALSLMPLVDSAAGSVIATCLNDPARTDPTFALAQRLWDSPDELVRCFDPAHPLLSHGIVVVEGQARWNAVLTVPALVARELLFPGAELPASLEPVAPRAVGAEISMAAARFVAGAGDRMRIIPVIGPSGAPLAGIAAAHAAASFNTMVQPSKSLGRDQLAPVLTTAWLRGSAVYLPVDFLANAGGHDAAMERLPLSALPIAVFVGSRDIPQFKEIDGCALPPIRVPSLTYAERLECWRRVVPSLASYAALAEVARRFRYECAAIERIGAELAALDQAPTVEELLTAVRADLDFGALAQPVTPRFDLAELMLPPVQTRQIEDIIRAMNNLTRVHYEWGTARAWNECGLAALFAGPPGTGKTMAAEAIASALALPLYRIDLSQVVNKYIGETEKNLRRLFDAAESADVILFFDEADALFGKRTEVKDAHDRYANLEISYLLERMERFKGIAILATNRKRDLDEAFLRRLRFLVDFPLPGAAERRRIWQVVIPPGVDASGLDLEFLAQRFPLAGGHIRAIVFHACLQSAAEGAAHTLTMPAIIRCVQREYDKLDRASSLHQFGPYAPLVAAERTRP